MITPINHSLPSKYQILHLNISYQIAGIAGMPECQECRNTSSVTIPSQEPHNKCQPCQPVSLTTPYLADIINTEVISSLFTSS